MKLIHLLLIISLSFSFINNSIQSNQRNLESTNTEKKFVLLGFSEYTETETGSQTNFTITLKSYTNNYAILSNFFYLTSLINYKNETNNSEVKWECNNPTPERDIKFPFSYYCTINEYKHNITRVQLKNYNITNSTGHVIISEDEILMSSFALEQKDNIQKYDSNLDFLVFNLYNISSKKDEIRLYGNLSEEIYEKESNLTLKLNGIPIICSYYYNHSKDSNGIDMISFSLQKSINDNLNGKMLTPLSNSSSQYVLIFSNGTDDSIIYSTEEISNADLYGFGNYSQPATNKNATNTATFLGTTNILKKFVRFTAIIKYLTNSTLRYLEEIKVNATGKRDPKSIDFKNGIVKYHIDYNNTANMTNIIGIESLHDYKFSDDENNFPSTSAIITIIGYYINLMNTAQLENPIFIDFGREKPIIDEKTFSFKFGFNSTNSNISITKKEKVFLNYSSMETSERDEIDCCTIENNTNIFTVSCEPTKDIYTLLNTLIIKVPTETQNRRLRFLQSSGNSTIHAPKTATGDIQFDYNPEVNTFARKTSKKKGLSGGAIAAIVLATVAAVAAVGIAMFFLNRGPINPIKTSTEMNLPNSTTNINN